MVFVSPGSSALARSPVYVLGFSLAVFVYGGYALFRMRWDSGQVMPSMGIRKAWFHLVLPLGGVLISLLATGRTISAIRAGAAEEEGAR